MFNPLRLLRRKDYIDDAATAFIENRATEQDETALRKRESNEPGLREDLESIRQTVSLLRSVETVRAPRSFALSHAPAPIRRSSMPRFAMAPAVFAIAAAAAVGLLAVGNLADVVRQSDGGGNDSSVPGSTVNSSAELAVATATVVALDDRGPTGEPGSPGVPAESESQAASGGIAGSQESAGVAATATVPAAQPTGTPAPFPTSAPAIEEDKLAVAPAVPPSDMTDGSRIPSGATTGPVQGADAAVEEPPGAVPEPEGTAPAFVLPESGGTENEVNIGAGTAVLPYVPGDDTEELKALPEATISIATGAGSGELAAEAQEPQDRPAAAMAGADESGFAIPLWQLQVGFAGLAVLMAGAWVLLQRRRLG